VEEATAERDIMIWSDTTLRNHGPRIFEPYSPDQIRRLEDGTPIKSRGQSSAGYDIATSNRWRLPNPLFEGRVDLRQPWTLSEAFQRQDASVIVLPPHGICFAESAEYITMPVDVLGLAIGKSTDARRGINVYITPLEPGWCGHLVIEIVNHSPFQQVLRAGEGIAQILFMELDAAPAVDYGSRESAYQGQTGVRGARLEPTMEGLL
jgi:dCTP deaminase